jgi:hypothetical protein
MHKAEEMMKSVNIDGSPEVQAMMQTQVDAELQHLKDLIELMEKER